MIDAKCMHYSEDKDEDEKQEQSTDRNIVNQMIIYMDYGNRTDLGFVIFADSKLRDEVVIKQDCRQLIFLNCFPFHTISDLALEKLKLKFLPNFKKLSSYSVHDDIFL